jgi:hypothetical protein
MEWYTVMYPRGQSGLPDDLVTAYVDSLRTTGAAPRSMTTRRREPRDATTPRGSAMSAWPLHRAAPNRSLLRASATPTPSGGLGSTNSRRPDASSTRSWPFYTKSLAWVLSPTIDARRRMFLCRESPARGTTTGASAVRLPISPTVAHLRHRRVDRCDNNRCANEGANIDAGANANADADAPPLFRWASQNLAAAAMLLRGCPVPATSEERRVRQHLKALLEAMAAQQAESSA